MFFTFYWNDYFYICTMNGKWINTINKYDNDIDTLQIDLDRLGEWVVENVMKINPGQGKALSFTRARVKGPLNYILGTIEFRQQAAANI